MNSIQSTSYPILFDKIAYQNLSKLIIDKNYSSVFILVDSNTLEHCYPIFAQELTTDKRIEVIEITPGESNKNIETCVGVWNVMTELNADRKSLLINLGGGVVGDLGGFVASTFKRGIDFITIPTSLLAMVDASVGGKTGVDLGNLKNQIGLFSDPEMVIIDPNYLHTLDFREIRSGLAEIIKHSLISDYQIFKAIESINDLNIFDLIYPSIEIKNNIILQDPKEQGIRKALNFGHTIGHAVESYCLEANRENLTHGEAIAIGMICELYISHKIFSISDLELQNITKTIIKIYGKVSFSPKEFNAIYDLLIHDKKNINQEILFVLLENIERYIIDCKVSKELIYKSFDFYNDLF